MNQDPAIPTVIYQDEHLIVINKPAGLLSVQDGYDRTLPHLRDVLGPLYGRLWMVHRLDKDTSGILLMARDADAHRILNGSFRERELLKKYHALVVPVPDWGEMDIQLPLKANADREHRTRPNDHTGKYAHSICKILKWFDRGVLMEIQILTGITHQIRAHLRAYNLALLGETKYQIGLPDPPFDAPRAMLHARTIAFTHPITKEQMAFTAPYPDDFREAYHKLRVTTAQDEVI